MGKKVYGTNSRGEVVTVTFTGGQYYVIKAQVPGWASHTWITDSAAVAARIATKIAAE